MSAYTNLNSKLDNSRLRRISCHDGIQFSKDSIVNVMEKFVKTVNAMDETILVPCRLMDRQVGDSSDNLTAPGKDSTSNQHSHDKRNGGGAMNSKNVYEFLHSSELFNLYNVLNALKTELLWCGKDKDLLVECEQQAAALNEVETRIAANAESPDSKTDASSTTLTATTVTVKGHIRRPSTASVASTASGSNISDSESDISTTENDSGVESEGNKSDAAQSSANSIASSDSDAPKANNNPADKATELAKRCRRHLNGLMQCLEQMTEASNYLTARYQSDIGSV